MPLPNLIVIGAMKCGTTSLHRYLDKHPDIAMSRDKARTSLVETLRDDANRFREFAGRDFADWSV